VNHAKTVLQTPDDLIKSQKGSAVIICSHNIQNHDQMLWYKQSQDKPGLQLMGYLYFKDNIEPEFTNKIKLEGDAKKNGSLTIQNLTPQDSSVVNGGVNQSPSNLIKSEKDTAELVCEHNIPSYNMIFWYKQPLSRDFTLLGYTWSTVGGSVVEQEPILWKEKGSSAVLNCIQNKGATYNLMYWYKQRPGESIKLIVITNAYGDSEFGDVDKNKFDTEKTDTKSGSLTVKNLEPGDSAIYFCSATACLGKTVLQTPDNLIRNQDESAVIMCSHKIPSYERILWYKQSQDSLGLKLMGYLNYDAENKESEFKDKIKLKGDGRNDGTVGADDVIQEPKILWGQKESSVQMNCTHNKGSTYRLMYWYRQRQGQTMRLVAFTTSYTPPEYEDSEANKFLANKTIAESGFLTVKNLEPSDSAIYFCSQKHLVKETKMNTLNGVSVSLMMFTVVCFGNTVLQTPDDLLKKQDESAVITCTHSIKDYDRILWYKQNQDVLDFKLMGNLYFQTETSEPEF
ncbi:hypothetical protein QQF64_011308, partial [Cirrhinus molitorella]